MSQKKTKILIVDDDMEIRKVLHLLLEEEQYEAVEVSNGFEALDIIDDSFDLIILDIMMPKKDGITTCIEIRKTYWVPILFLTAKATEYDKQIGFSIGCDDYLSKPFSRIELLARISALMPRFNTYQGRKLKPDESKIIVNDIVIDTLTSRVFQNDLEIHLTNIEYNILLLLAKNPTKIFTLENIYESVWEESYDYLANSTIMVHIKNLRRKLNDTSHTSKYIKNIWGRGYCIASI